MGAIADLIYLHKAINQKLFIANQKTIDDIAEAVEEAEGVSCVFMSMNCVEDGKIYEIEDTRVKAVLLEIKAKSEEMRKNEQNK